MTDCNESHENRPKIDLSLNSAGVIILVNSGVIYENVTCGTACVRRCEEGVLLLPTMPELVPDSSTEVYLCPVEAKLKAMEWGPIQGINVVRASEIDSVLKNYGFTKGISVDKTRLQESEEAWVYVDVEPAELSLYSGFGSCKGVIVWANSD